MVQKYQSPVRVYKHPFELVMRAYEKRFPTCEQIPIVRETEILEEVVDDVTGIHMIDRRAKVRQEKISNYCYCSGIGTFQSIWYDLRSFTPT